MIDDNENKNEKMNIKYRIKSFEGKEDLLPYLEELLEYNQKNSDEKVEINKEEKISKNEINYNPENENINNDKIEEKSITDNSKKNGQNTSHDLLLVDKKNYPGQIKSIKA